MVKATKKDMLIGMCVLAFPSLLGIYAMAHLYITNISGWLTAESNALGGNSMAILTLCDFWCTFWAILGEFFEPPVQRGK